MTQRTHYDTLGVPSDASADTVKAAYRSLMRKHHPDIAGPSGAAQALLINAAMSELGDPGRRHAYDRSIRPEPVPQPTPAPPQSQPPRQAPRFRDVPAPDTYDYRPIDEEEPLAVPLLERPYFKALLVSAGVGLLLLLSSMFYFWWRAFLVDPPVGPLAGAPLLLVVVALVGTLAEQGRVWPWVMLAVIVVVIPPSAVSVGILGLLFGGGIFRLATQSLRNHWRTRPLVRR